MQEHAPLREQEVGVVTHYWGHLGVAGVHLTGPLDVGDHVHILGHTSDLELDVSQLEIEHLPVQHADPGSDVGLRVTEHVREHDHVYKSVDARDVGLWGSEL